MGISDDLVPWIFCLSDRVYTEPLAIHQLQFRAPLQALVPIEASAPIGCNFLYLSVILSNIGGRGSSCDFTFLTDGRRAVDF